MHGTLDLAWSFGIAANNLDLVRMDHIRVIEFEVDIFDDERPNLVAEPVGIQMSLEIPFSPKSSLIANTSTYFESQSLLDLLSQYFRNGLVKVRQDLHGQLGLDATFGNESVQRICEGSAQTIASQ